MGIDHEAHVSTKQEQAKADPWISYSNEHPEWPKYHQAKKGKGPKKTRRLIPPPPPARHRPDPNHSPRSDRPSGVVRLGRATQPGEAINTKHFTLYAGLASTKKRQLKLAFGVRAGSSTVRNRAKRQARETFRLNHHKLPGGIDLVVSTRGAIGALTRRALRDQLSELFDRARKLSPPREPGGASKQ